MQKSYHTKLQRPTFLYYYQTATFLTCNEWVDHELPSKQWAWILGIVIIALVSKVCRLVVFSKMCLFCAVLIAFALCVLELPGYPAPRKIDPFSKVPPSKSMLLLSLHQLFRPNVYLLQVGIILIMLQVPHIAKRKWAEFFLIFKYLHLQ